jgi:uncharacterized PurR-regulated membrane protein YhhQ (DUF165 family)
VLAKMKVWTSGRMLWTRTISSTVAGQAVDSLIVSFGLFAGTLRPFKLKDRVRRLDGFEPLTWMLTII